jgi:DNA-binding FrmR family transcriptional regulator
MTTTEAGATAPSGKDEQNVTYGYHKQKDEHLKRLRRIEGQIRGLQRMVEEDVYCIDILTQVSASTKALQSFALQLLEEHLRHCVADAAVKGGTEIDAKVEEATKAIGRLLRT